MKNNIAFTTKSLEQIAAQELRHLDPQCSVKEINTKRIIFETKSILHIMKNCRTIDDIGMLVWEGNIQNFNEFEWCVDQLNFDETNTTIKRLRPLENEFSITVTQTGVNWNKNVSIAQLFAQKFIQKTGWTYSENKRTNFDIRIFVDNTDMSISVRRASQGLHVRTYDHETQEGSLKPTIAATMIQVLTEWQTGKTIIDTFCGSGTILAEALSMGNFVYGSDINPQSVQRAKNNVTKIGYNPEEKIKTADATNSKWPDNYFDCAISNLPWGKQVKITNISELYHGVIREYKRILKDSGSLCLLLTKPDLMIKYAKKYFPDKHISVIKIGYLATNTRNGSY